MYRKAVRPASFLTITLLCLLLLQCGGKDSKQAVPAAVPETDPRYEVLEMQAREASFYIEFLGEIAGVQDVEIRPNVSGYLEAIYVDEGEEVREGQQLFQIRDEEYQAQVLTTEANLDRDIAKLEQISSEIERLRPLVEANAISYARLEAAEAEEKALRATIEYSKAQITQAKTRLGYTTLQAPASGIIGTIPYTLGSLVSGADVLTKLSNISSVYVYVDISERAYLNLVQSIPGSIREKIAQQLPVQLIMANDSIYPHEGKLEMINRAVNPRTGTITTRVRFPNPNKLLRPGGFAKIRIKRVRDEALLVPLDAVFELQGVSFVYELTEENVVKSTPIEVFPRTSGNYYIVTSGLSPGDRIVASQIFSIREGMKIDPVPAKTEPIIQ